MNFFEKNTLIKTKKKYHKTKVKVEEDNDIIIQKETTRRKKIQDNFNSPLTFFEDNEEIQKNFVKKKEKEIEEFLNDTLIEKEDDNSEFLLHKITGKETLQGLSLKFSVSVEFSIFYFYLKNLCYIRFLN